MSYQDESRAAQSIQLTEYQPPEEGLWCAQIKDIREIPSRFEEGTYQYQFDAEIWQVGGDAEDFRFWCSKKYVSGSRPSNLFLWVSGFTGTENLPEVFEPTEWMMKYLMLDIKHNPVYDDNGQVKKVNAKVKSFLPPSKAMAEEIEKDPVAEIPGFDSTPTVTEDKVPLWQRLTK